MSEKPRLSYSDDSADDIDVPRVERDIYRMAGRAAPQRIEPRAPEASPAQAPAAASADAAESKPSSKTESTTASKSENENVDTVVSTSVEEDTASASASKSERKSSTVEQPQSEAPIRGKQRTSASSRKTDKSADTEEKQNEPTEVFAQTHLASAPTAGAGEPGRTSDYSEPLRTPEPTAETTVLPRSDASVNSDDYDGGVVGAAGAGAMDEAEHSDSDRSMTDYAREAPRGTIDFGILLLRLTLAAVFLYHGLVTLFGVGGSGGVDGLESSLAGIQAAGVLAWAIPIVEILAGVLIILGVIGPLGVALGLAVSSFLTLHTLGAQPADVAFTALPVATKYWGLAALATVAINFMGPGRLSFDRGRRWAHRPVMSGFIGVIVGLALGAGGWFLLGGSLPAFV